MIVPRLTPDRGCAESCCRKEKAPTLGRAVRLGAILCIGASSSLSAQAVVPDPHAVVKPTLVHLTATVNDTLDNAYATGVVISADGLVLTSYRLLSILKEDDNTRLTIQAAVDGVEVGTATRVDAREDLNLLLLQLPYSSYPKAMLRRSIPTSPEGVDVYTSGYVRSHDKPALVVTSGTLLPNDSPDNILRRTTIQFTKEQIGSPLYDGAGYLIGIANWSTGDVDNSFTPIQYADALISYVRLTEVNETLAAMNKLVEIIKAVLGHDAVQMPSGTATFNTRVKEVEHAIGTLRNQIEWRPPRLNKEECSISLGYEKLLSGGLLLRRIGVQMTPRASPPMKPLKAGAEIEVTGTMDDDGLGCTFDLDAFYGDIEKLNEVYPDVREFEVRVAPTLEDGTKLEPTSLTVFF